MHLYDQLKDTQTAHVAKEWFTGFYQRKFVVNHSRSPEHIDHVSMFYDPDIDYLSGQ